MSRWLLPLVLLAPGGCQRTEVVESFPNSYVGVGLELRMADGYPEVVRTLPGSSAHQAGVQPGDRIVRIDGHPTAGETLGNVVMRIRGLPQSQVTLALDRGRERIIIVVRRKKMAKDGEANYHAAGE
jgi:carboxyl-terminal processing protease